MKNKKRVNILTGLIIFGVSLNALAESDTFEVAPRIKCVTSDSIIYLSKFDKDLDYYRILPSIKDTVHIINIKTDDKKSVEEIYLEKKRKTRFENNLADFIEFIEDKNKESSTSKLVPELNCISITQKQKRSIITLKSYSTKGDEEEESLLREYKFITGPEENFYISADMPVNNVKQLKFNSQTNTVEEREAPSSFYLGFNYKIGDVFTSYPASKWYKDISIKGLVQASSKPFESAGIGLSYNFKYLDLFIAQVWTKDDESAGTTELGTTNSTIVGISFNLSKGLDWLKS